MWSVGLIEPALSERFGHADVGNVDLALDHDRVDQEVTSNSKPFDAWLDRIGALGVIEDPSDCLLKNSLPWVLLAQPEPVAACFSLIGILPGTFAFDDVIGRQRPKVVPNRSHVPSVFPADPLDGLTITQATQTYG